MLNIFNHLFVTQRPPGTGVDAEVSTAFKEELCLNFFLFQRTSKLLIISPEIS